MGHNLAVLAIFQETLSDIVFHQVREVGESENFAGVDPLRENAGGNFYAYVGDDPINSVDPSGLLVQVWCEPVQQYQLGRITGARHCRLLDIGYDYDWSFERLGPTTLKREPYYYTRPGYPVPVTRPVAGRKDKDFENCIRDQFDYYETHIALLPKYDAIESNSNQFLQLLVSKCGGHIEYSTFQFGGFFQLPPPWFNFYGRTELPDRHSNRLK